MGKFAQKTMAMDAIKHDPKNGQFASSVNDMGKKVYEPVSSEEHAHAAQYHSGMQEHHETEAKSRGENTSKPGSGSHAEAASFHGSAAFYHNRAAVTGDVKDKTEAYKKSSVANNKTKAIKKQGDNYNAEKQNDLKSSSGYDRVGAINRYLSQKHIGLIKR